MKYLHLFLTALLLVSCNSAQDSADTDPPPNFVIIFIDDMGYGDIGPFGSTVNETPHLDRMAEEGLKMTSFYVTSPVCTPSRAGLLTGSYPKRVGLAKFSSHTIGGNEWVLFPGDKTGLNPGEITIADLLKKAGYATGIFGKWHLGDQPQFLPTEQGFDEYFGIPYSNDMWPQNNNWQFPPLPVVQSKKVVDTVETMDDQAKLAYRFTKHATDFIREHEDQPFFVYLPHAFIHYPRAARQQFMSDANNVTEAQIEEVDWSTGRILQTLREEGLDKNTLVIFTSDNGGAGTDMGPLRGGKATVWEGGFREPTIAWWPGTIPAGTVTGEMATAMDLLPTFADLAGVELPADRKIDGKNITNLLKSPSKAASPHEYFYYYVKDSLQAVRSGPWKFIRPDKLYHLEQDIGESNNLAAEHPDVVKRLKQAMHRFDRQLEKNIRKPGKVDHPRPLLPVPGSGSD